MASLTLKSDKGVPVRVTEVDRPLQVNKNFVNEDLRSSGIILEFNKGHFSWRPGRHCDEQGLKRTEQRETHRRYMGAGQERSRTASGHCHSPDSALKHRVAYHACPLLRNVAVGIFENLKRIYLFMYVSTL